MDERFKDKPVPKRDFENQELIRPEQGSFPTITEKELENFLDTDTGRETFAGFAGFVDDGVQARPALYYLHHTEYPELGEKLQNLCFYLRGLKGKEIEVNSPLEFYKYGLYLVLNRGLRPMTSGAMEIPNQNLELLKKEATPENISVSMPQFRIRDDINLENRVMALRAIQNLTRNLLSEIIRLGIKNLDEILPFAKNFISETSTLRELKNVGITEIFFNTESDSYLDLENMQI